MFTYMGSISRIWFYMVGKLKLNIFLGASFTPMMLTTSTYFMNYLFMKPAISFCSIYALMFSTAGLNIAGLLGFFYPGLGLFC